VSGGAESGLGTVRTFLRVLGGVLFIAFASFGIQASGLVGSRGILPFAEYLSAAREGLGRAAYWDAPSLLWLRPTDGALTSLWIAGALCALVAVWGRFQRAAIALCLILWISVCTVGQDFLSFQWDILLSEVAFLAIFAASSPVRILLFRALLFRLMFLSGAVKLLSGDHTWRNLSAMAYHYETQPLPTPLAWYMHQLPLGFHKAETLVVFAVELVVPFFFFAPRRLRHIAGIVTIGLQTLILLTGNYTYFNFLAIALTLWLWIEPVPVTDSWRRGVDIALAVVIGTLGALVLLEAFSLNPAPTILRAVAPLRIVNSYGLFAVMTTTRPEIVLEGSNDGDNWTAYEFPYKPGDVRRAPPIVAPHQPRLDWQMWFAALGTYRENPWFTNLILRLLQGEPSVLRLLRYNPFPNSPPKYVRARLYRYHFTRFGNRDWWSREEHGLYLPPVSLR
jgi:hypothetical protein